MSHFAKVLNSKVVDNIKAEPKFFLPRDQGGDGFVDTSPGEWIQTSYNTRGGIHYGDDGLPDGGVPLRGNYAGVGFHYDPTVVIDGVVGVFYPPSLYPSWTLNRTTWLWDAPTPMPDDGKPYAWQESTQSWVEIVTPAA
jgi:hypothetical protein